MHATILFLLIAAADAGVPAAAAADKWGVYAEKTNEGNNLSCWVCLASAAGSAACLGNVLIPDTNWDTKDQAVASACVLKRRGKCLVVQNAKCAGSNKRAAKKKKS